MGLGNVLKSIKKRADAFFGGEKPSEAPDLDLLDKLDRSWSGRARDGPVHYHGPLYHARSREGSVRYGHGHSYSSREGSVRAAYPTSNDGSVRRSFPPPDSSIARNGSVPSDLSTHGLRRTSSEPCLINTAAQSHNSKQDSASSMHNAQMNTSAPSAPVDIGTGVACPVPARPQKPRKSALKRPTLQPGKALVTPDSAPHPISEQNDTLLSSQARARNPRSPGPTKHGGLSTALSKEPSVRHGHHGLPAVSHGEVAEDGIEDWGKRAVTFTIVRSDSARLDGSSGSDGCAGTGVHPPPPSAAALDPEALAAALSALGSGAKGGVEVEVEDVPEPSNVIIADTSLATQWPLAASDKAASDPTELHQSTGTGHADGLSSGSESGAAASLSGSAKEWNARFVRRWKAVKQRARLQALGVRSIWKLSSPNGSAHHLPELLINEVRNESPRASPHAGGLPLRQHDSSFPRDPSLANMLLADEVC